MPALDIPENWTFNEKTIAENFDNHVREQLPWYDLVYDAIEHIVRGYLPANGLIYDIGASSGNMELKLSALLEQRKARFIALDNSDEMKKIYKGRELIICDATDYDYEAFDIGIMFLSLMFFPVNTRLDFIKGLLARLNKGGALIIVDKCLPDDGYAALLTSKLNLFYKKKNGISSDDIIKKELSLIGIQRPISRKMFLDFGYEWFRLGDFCGWILEK